MEARQEMRVAVQGERVRLLSPGVGLFTCAEPAGRVLTPGQVAGHLIVLGRTVALVVPDGVTGRVCSPAPERVHEPVDWTAVLYELEPLDAARAAPVLAAAASEDGPGGLVVRSPQTGRFWHRAAPGEPPLVSAGSELADGGAVGLIEVMKTFTQVRYRAGGTLPARARVVRMLVDDGEDVSEGAPLVEVEAAGP